MANLKKRALSLLLAVMMMLSAMPMNAIALEFPNLGGLAEVAELLGKGKLVCEDENHHDHGEDCYVTTQVMQTEHSDNCYHGHTADCYNFTNFGCSYRKTFLGKVPTCGHVLVHCGMTEETRVCNDQHGYVDVTELVCTMEEHNDDCYFNLDDIGAMFEGMSAEEAAESAFTFGKCWLNGGECGLTYKLGEIEMNLCKDHFCNVCNRLHKYCDCVKITFANIGNNPEKTKVVTVRNGETVPAEMIPNAELFNYHFLGWFDEDGNEFDAETVYTEDITFTAQYKVITEAEKLESIIEFIKNNFDLGAELGRMITILSNHQVTKETFVNEKDAAIAAIELYLLTNQLTGKISADQAKEIVDLMKQSDEYAELFAEWLWPENHTYVPTIDEILEKVDFQKLAEEIKDMIADEYGIELDENWIENNRALADQYIAEALEQVKTLGEEQKQALIEELKAEKANAEFVLAMIRCEMVRSIAAEIENAKEFVREILADRELGIKIGKNITLMSGLTNETAKTYGAEFKAAMIAALRMSNLDEKCQDAMIEAMDGNDGYVVEVINWLWPQVTVIWVSEDVVLETDVVAYDAQHVFNGEDPVKEGNAEYTYTFSGWSKFFDAKTSEYTYTAVFTADVNEYTVTWMNDGSVLAADSVAYGTIPMYNGETPVKESTAQYTYTFAGWDKEISAVTGDVTYTAMFTAEVNSYAVTFVVDGVKTTNTYEYGAMPSFGSEPTKAADAQYTYKFAGWDKEITAVTGDVTYTALFTGIVNEYTVIWVNEDGSVIMTETYAYGETPVFTGATPFKADTAEFSYDFAGWGEITAVTGDVTYTAQFDATRCTYRVTFKDGDEILSSLIYAYGDTIVAPELPTRKGFNSEWSCEFSTVTGELTVEVIWSNQVFESHKLLVFVGYGVSAMGNTSNWFQTSNGVINNVTSYHALYETNKKESILTEGVDYESYTANPGNITVNGIVYGNETGSDFYVINEYVVVATKAEYHLDCHATLYHTVTFVDYNGNVIDTVAVQHGEAAVAPEVSRKGYVFTGWSEDFSAVKNSMTVTAEYEYEYLKTGKLKVNVGNGTPASGSTKGNAVSHWGKIYDVRSYNSYYDYPNYTGDSVMSTDDFDFARTHEENVPGTVTYMGVTYTNGEGSSDNYYVLTGEFTYVACRSEYHLDYKASFYNVYTYMVDGSEIKVVALQGTDPSAPADPVKEGYDFLGWEESVNENGNKVYTAKFEIKTYSVTFYLPTGGNTKIYVKHGDLLEEFIPKAAAGERFLYWYNSKGGAKLDYSKPITGNMAFSAKCKWIIEDHDVTLMGVLNGTNYNLGMAVFEDSYHARKYSNKWLSADQYDPAKIILPDTLNDITVDGVTYTYGSGDNYYTVEFDALDSHMEKGYSYRYYGDVVLYHKQVNVFTTVNGQRTGRVILKDVEHGTVLTREMLGLGHGQFIAEETVITVGGTIYVEIGEHTDRFACREAGTLVMVGVDNGVYKYECSHCGRNFRSEDGNQAG